MKVASVEQLLTSTLSFHKKLRSKTDFATQIWWILRPGRIAWAIQPGRIAWSHSVVALDCASPTLLLLIFLDWDLHNPPGYMSWHCSVVTCWATSLSSSSTNKLALFKLTRYTSDRLVAMLSSNNFARGFRDSRPRPTTTTRTPRCFNLATFSFASFASWKMPSE